MKKQIFPISINNKLINIQANSLYQALQIAKIKSKEGKK